MKILIVLDTSNQIVIKKMFLLVISDDFWQLGRLTMKKYYPITRFWALHTALISVGHPEDLEVRNDGLVKKILLRLLSKHKIFDFIKYIGST